MLYRPHTRGIKLEDSVFVLYDLASSNGTYVNGERAERLLLNDGDKIQVGETLFILQGSIARRISSNLK